MEELKLGVISDANGESNKIKKLANKLKKHKIGAFILAGEIGKDKKEFSSLFNILRFFQKTRIPTYIIPGSHEKFKNYNKALKRFKEADLIFDGRKKKTFNLKGYNLIFLPGSDSLWPGASFRLVDNKKEEKEKKKKDKKSKYFKASEMKYVRVSDLIQKGKIKKNLILISHVPARFYGKYGIDRAYFGAIKKQFEVKKEGIRRLPKLPWNKDIYKEVFSENRILPANIALPRKKLGYPIKMNNKNVGLESMSKIIKKLKITKGISAHIHEAGRKGCTISSKLVKPNQWSRSLFYNPGEAESGFAGIFTIKGNEAKYQNIRI